LLYRSTELSKLSEADEATLAGFGLHTVFDLRTAAEQENQPDLLPDGVTLIPCDVMADATEAAPAQMEDVLSDPTTATSLLADGQGMAYMVGAYRQFVAMPSGLAAYRRLFSTLLEPGTLPALFHCATGKDRTGWATAVLFMLLGVPDDVVRAEYLLTNEYLLPALQPVFDLRTAAEQQNQPDLLPDGVTLIPCDVMADATDAAPAQMEDVLSDPTTARSLLADGQGMAYMVGAYRQFVAMPSGLAAYRRLFSTLLEPGRLPALFHCATGKDRTGWATAVLLMLLGVPDEAVRAEYLLTNDYLLPALQPVFALFGAAGGDPELLRPLLGVDPSYLDAAVDEMRARYGTVESYFADGLRLDAAAQEQLKALLLE